MKKLFFLAILPLMMAMVTFSSCSEDEGAGADNEVLEGFDYPEDELFGTWEVKEMDGEKVHGEEFARFSRNKTCRVLGIDLEYSAKGSKIKGYYSDYLLMSLDITKWNYPEMKGEFKIYDEDGDVEEAYEVVLKKD